jgi:hypothetical protein
VSYVSIQMEIACDGCGGPLTTDTKSQKKNGYREDYISVEACPHCMREAKQEGRDEAKDEDRE